MGVIALSKEHLDEAAEVLAVAFEDYPLVRYFLAGEGPACPDRLRQMFRLTCQYRLSVGWPLLGAMSDGALAAVACVSGINHRPDPPEIERRERAFMAAIGQQAAERIEAYSQAKALHAPAQPHYYLAAIGVRPETRGHGLAGALIRHVHAISQSDPQSMGVGLDTELASNVAIYEYFGYRRTAETRIGPVPIWWMYRQTAAP